jgi:hypothetical protein
MKYRSSLLHTCWCIVFECLNSNLYLNSFGWIVFVFFQNRKPFPFTFFPSPQSGPLNPAPQPTSTAAQLTGGPAWPAVRCRPAEADGRASPVISFPAPLPTPLPSRGRVRLGVRATPSRSRGPAR